MWALSSSESGKFRIFGKNLPQWTIPPLAIFTKLGEGTVAQVRALTPNFTVVALKMCTYRRQNRQNC